MAAEVETNQYQTGKSRDPEVTELKSKPWTTKIYLRFPPPTIIFKILLMVHEYLPCIMHHISYCIMFYYVSIKHIEIRQNSPVTPPCLLVPGPCLSSQIHVLVELVHVSIPFSLNMHPRNIPALLCLFSLKTLCMHLFKLDFPPLIYIIKHIKTRDFSCGPVAKTPHSQGRDPRFDSCSGNWIPHVATNAETKK